VGASGDLTVLADGATGWLLLNVLPLYSVRIQAASASNTIALTAHAIGKA
jgi:hypothetical protein